MAGSSLCASPLRQGRGEDAGIFRAGFAFLQRNAYLYCRIHLKCVIVMWRRTFWVVCIVSLLLVVRAGAQSVTVYNIVYAIDQEAHAATVTDYEGTPVDIVIPPAVEYEGEAYPVREIGDGAFRLCRSLENVVLPKSLQSVGWQAFAGSDALEGIIIPEGVASIGSYAFGECIKLSNVSLPSTLESIGNTAFHGCISLESIIIPEGVAAIGEGTFWECRSLRSVTLPEGLQSIGDRAFKLCRSLSDVDIPEGVTDIGAEAFLNCPLHDGLALPSTLQSIGFQAFWSCKNLKGINIPAGIVSIGNIAFADCPLTDIYCQGAVPPAIGERTFDEDTYGAAVLHVPFGAVGGYQAAQWWNLFQNVEGDLPPVSICDVPSVAPLAWYANGVVTTESPAGIEVYAPGGARVLHAVDATSLSLQGLPCGIYIIGIEAEGRREVLKVLR